ncbi:MAG: hypothetical protein WBX22_32840 [Silvibacterium sp.]
MAEDNPTTPPCQRVPIPIGYRQGIITAITVLLGFSLLFFRYFDFELPGEWTISSAIAAIVMDLSISYNSSHCGDRCRSRTTTKLSTVSLSAGFSHLR